MKISWKFPCLHEIPPNGQGLAALMALGILRYHDIQKYPVDSAESIHLQIEAMKIAFADAHRHIADPEYMLRSSAELRGYGRACIPHFPDRMIAGVDLRQRK